MKKYNLSNIMKKAWEFVKKIGATMSEGLKKAWEIAKRRSQLIQKLEEIVAENNSHDNGYHYRAVVNDWENYGKSRTYFSCVETRDYSKHYATTKYGYIDNVTGEYVPERYASLEK